MVEGGETKKAEMAWLTVEIIEAVNKDLSQSTATVVGVEPSVSAENVQSPMTLSPVGAMAGRNWREEAIIIPAAEFIVWTDVANSTTTIPSIIHTTTNRTIKIDLSTGGIIMDCVIAMVEMAEVEVIEASVVGMVVQTGSK